MRRVGVTPSGPQPGDVDTAITHDSDSVGPMWSSPTPVREHVTRHSETQGPAPGEAAGGKIPVSLRGFSDKHSSIPAHVELTGSHCKAHSPHTLESNPISLDPKISNSSREEYTSVFLTLGAFDISSNRRHVQ
jgi:hypothetical protein